VFVASTTLIAGWRSIFDNFLKDANTQRGYTNVTLTAIMMACVVIVLIDSILKWRKTIRSSKGLSEALPATGD
jgi:hypothetical protein